MASRKNRALEQSDLDRAARAVGEIFKTDTVYIIGSQALLVGRPDIERGLRFSLEFDAYPSNARTWEAEHPGEEASEHIFAQLGDGSQFHLQHNYYVDGVDDKTATLPADWPKRQVERVIQDGDKQIKIIAPSPADLVASKLCRGDPKDVAFTRGVLRSGLAKHDQIKKLIGKIEADPIILERAVTLLEMAAKSQNLRDVVKGPPDREPLEFLLLKRKGGPSRD